MSANPSLLTPFYQGGEPRIIAEEKEFIVVLKPAGWLVHPVSKSPLPSRERVRVRGGRACSPSPQPSPSEGGGSSDPTLVSWLLARYPELKHIGPDPARPGIVHRLDAPVSGVMVVARTPEMHAHLVREFTERKVKKEYAALVHGRVIRDNGIIDFPLTRGPKGTMVAHPLSSRGDLNAPLLAKEGLGEVDFAPTPSYSPSGRGSNERDAITEFEVIRRWPHKTLLRVLPKTGRMHQIRVHLKAIGHPVVGDALYAIKRYKEKTPAPRLMLHAVRIGFADLQGQWREYEAPPPQELKQLSN